MNSQSITDPVEYLDKIKNCIKKLISTSSWLDNSNKIDFGTLTQFIKYLFDCLTNPFRFLISLQQSNISDTFKLKYTDLFNTNMQFLQEKLKLIKETNKVYTNNTGFTNIENVIEEFFTQPILEIVQDKEWLNSLMSNYPTLIANVAFLRYK